MVKTPPAGASLAAALAGGLPLGAVQQLQRERDHLLLLHEALAEVERAPSLEARLHVFVEAIRRVGFGRVTITLRDAELNATAIVTAGLSPDEDRLLRESPLPGEVWQRRLASIERFRISGSYYLDGRDPWVTSEFGGGLPSALAPTDDPTWSPHDTLVVPLRNASGVVIATLVLDDPDERARPTLTRVRTVELFAQQVAAMLEQASLIQLAERRSRRLQTLHEVGSLLARSLDEPTILRALARQVEATLSVRTVIALTTDAAGAPRPRVLRTNGHEQDVESTPSLLRSLAAVAARAQRPTRDGGALAVPALLGPTTMGAVVVESTSGDPLDADDTDLLMTIAAQAAAAISNARLYAESLRQRRQTEALADVARAVGESLQIDRVLQLILRHATALLRTDGANIALLRGDTLEVTAGVGTGEALIGRRVPLHGSMAGRAVRTASSIITEDVYADPDAFVPTAETAQIRNTIIVPLLSVQGPVGALSVFNRAAPFTTEDAEILQRLADQVAVAVVNARLFEEVAEATREWAVAFDSIGSGMVLLDKLGRIQRTNARARMLMGDAPESALLGTDFHRVLFGDEAPCEQCVHFAAIADGVVKRATHDNRARGRVFDVTAAPHPLGGAVVTFDDVTEHHALAERHRRVIETSRDAIVITDRDRRIAFANPAAHDMLGAGTELIGMPTECFVPEDQYSLVRAHEEAALGGEPQSYEGVVLRGDGDRRIVAINTAPLRDLGEVTGVVASMRDVTDERRARDAVALSESRYRSLFDSASARAVALERSEARYTRLVESASDAIFTVDEQGRFTAVNRTLEQAVGRQRESLIGAGFADLLDPRDLAAAQQLLRETYAGNRSRGAVRYRNAAGEVRHGSVITSPVFEDERIIGALGIMRDVTDERRLADQVLQQEKFVAVGQLVSGVAHELNNPLAGVMAFAQLLLASPLPLSDEPRQAVETIHREAQRAAKIVSSLLTFARQQPAERAAAQLNDIVTDTVELRRHALRTAGINLSLQLEPTLPATWADPFQLQQVVLNLLGNAEQALANWAGERMIRIRTVWEMGGKGGKIVIAVSDTGPGIAREQQDRVFNPFFTTKPVGQGTGLGLSISDGIVREHGGRIRVDSAPDSGATFVVEIPHVVPPRQEEVVETARPAMPVASRRMLVVDDEPSMRAAVSRFLESLGHVIQVASSGVEARALMATTDYDVVLLDLRMPGLGGEALYRELTERDPRHARRVVFVTGDLQSDDAQRFLHETGRPVIGKPFQLDDLAAVLASVNA